LTREDAKNWNQAHFALFKHGCDIKKGLKTGAKMRIEAMWLLWYHWVHQIKKSVLAGEKHVSYK